MAIDTEWSLVFMITTANELWSGVSLPEDTVGVLSVVLSNSRVNGRKHHKPYIRCTADELLEETLVQIGWDEADAIGRGFIGPDLHYIAHREFLVEQAKYAGWATAAVPNENESDADQVAVSDSQLYIRMPGNLTLEPENVTDVYNLFVAGEFTKTSFAKPTMEKACESGMRCARGDMPGALRIVRRHSIHKWRRVAIRIFANTEVAFLPIESRCCGHRSFVDLDCADIYALAAIKGGGKRNLAFANHTYAHFAIKV